MELAGIEIPMWSILLVVAAILGYIYSTWMHNTWSKQGVPGPRPWPIFGTFIFSMRVGGGSFPVHDGKMVELYGKLSGSYRGRSPVLDVADPEFLRLSMVKDFNSMTNRQDNNLGTIFDSFMTALSDDRWKHVRSSLSPTFTSGKLKLLKTQIDHCADKFVKYIGETNGEPFDLKRLAGGFTMDAISSTAFGVDVDSLKETNHPMIVNANKIMGTNSETTLLGRIRFMVRIITLVFLPSWLQKQLLKAGITVFDMEALKYFEEITRQIISQRESEETKPKDFVQLCVNQLIDEPELSDPATQIDKYGKAWSTKGLTKEEIIANAIFFYMAGYETTALTLHYILFELAMNPDIQERAYTEAMEHTSSDEASYEELSKMEYIDWIMQETMRLYPAAPRVERLVEKDTTIEGIQLPAGSYVSAMVYCIHHDPEIWPEPERFDPERFAPENKAGRHQYAWIPFGLGNRNCIGMRLALLEMKVAIVKILNNFVLEPCSETPNKPVKIAKNFQMAPETKIMLTARHRQ